MPIYRKTPDSAIDTSIDRVFERHNRALIQLLTDVGERCIVEARGGNGKQYIDQTGNLRSSVGYVVVKDGNIVSQSDFQQVKGGNEGASEGRVFAGKLKSETSTGIALIVVAGMNYATYVSAKGYNVLDSSELLAENLVSKMLKAVGFKVSKK